MKTQSLVTNKIEFTPGEAIVCIGQNGVGLQLTKGKTYSVVDFIPKVYEPNLGGFVWPAYVKVIDDNGKPGTFHAHRFTKEGA
jgi:hypothetical protein